MTEQLHTREGFEAFATAEAGSDYFETDVHYRALADRILGSVHDDRPFIAVIGDPPPSPHSLSASLDEAVAHEQPVMVLACGPLLRGDALLDVCRGLAAHTQANDRQPGALPFPLFIFDDAGQLADEQIKDIYKTSQSINHWIVVMLGGSDFLARLEHPEIRFARDELTTSLNFQELGPLEILPYIHHQVGTGEAARIFTDDVVADLRARSGGDPRIVNRLALDLLHDAAETADGPRSAGSLSPEPAPEPLDQPAPPDPASARFVPLAASLAGPDAPTAAGIPAEVPPSVDEDTLLDRLQRRLLGVPAETAASPPLPSEQPSGEAGDEPPPPSPAMQPAALEEQRQQPDAVITAAIPDAVSPPADNEAEAALQPAAQPAALEAPRQQSDAAIGAVIPAAVSPPADIEAEAVPLRPAALAASLPERLPLYWPAIAAVLCLIGVGWAGSVILQRQADRAVTAKPGLAGAASPSGQAASSATTEPTRSAPPPMEPPRAVPSPTAEPKASAVPAPPPAATAEPPRSAPPPTAAPETTAAPAASPAMPPATEPTPAASPAVPTPAAPAKAPVVALGLPPPVAARPAAAEVATLVARGDELFATGDVASARLFYERAADAGDAQAALRMGESFDPGFLDQAHVRGAKGDPATAIYWYRRARDLGSAEAEILLKSPEGK